MKLTQIVRLLEAEGRVAELEDRPEQAGRSYVEMIILGNEISRGGLLVDRLVGVGFEQFGYMRFVKLASKLQCHPSRSLISALEQLDQNRVIWDELYKNEKMFSRYEETESGELMDFLTGWWGEAKLLKRIKQKHDTSVVRARLLATELALRCFQSQQGRAPERLEQLVPQWLHKVPDDPFTGLPLIFQPQGTNWLLYSIGPDGVDDRGSPVSREPSPKGDLTVDSPW